MESHTSMIVRGQVLPVPSAPAQQFFAGDEQVRSAELHVSGLNQRFTLNSRNRPFLLVGRSRECDIRLQDSEVSYRHAQLQLVCGQVYCIDLASRRGTFWGKKRRSSGWLLPDRPIRVGPYTISSVPRENEPANLPAATALQRLSQQVVNSLPKGEIELRFLNSRHGQQGGRTWTVQQPITLVGSSKRCRLRLDDASVSRVHCSLMVTPAGLWITDLLGRDGTRVNGEPVTFQLLNQDDVVGIGGFRFAVNYRNTDGRFPQSQSDNTEEAKRSRGQREPDRSTQATPPVPHSGSLSEEFVLSLMDRFASMQQQMSAMNHQQMMVMAQLVGTMHQNHHDVVQQELHRINQISEQIEEIQRQLPAAASSPAAALPQSPSLEAMPIPRSVGYAQQDGKDETPVSDARGPTATESREDAGDAEASQPAEFAESPENGPRRDSQPASAGNQPAENGDSESTAKGSNGERKAPTADELASHTHLIERMASLERERTGRWKKIMRILTGSGP